MRRTYSVIIPVWDEAQSINTLVDHLRVVGYGRDVEILVADGHPGRTTLAALNRPGVVGVPAARGRARQMNAAALRSKGDVLVFLHADTTLPARAFDAMDDALADARSAGGAFDLAIRSPSLPLACIARVASLRSRLTRAPYGDQAIFLTRQAFAALGGYRDLPVLEDVDLMLRLKRAGLRLAFAKGRAATSPRRWREEGLAACTLRNWTLIALYLLGVSPERLAGLYPVRRTNSKEPPA